MEELKRQCEFVPGFDKRHEDPMKNYGISGGKFIFVVSGERGAVHFVCGANMYPDSAIAHLVGHYSNSAAEFAESVKPMGYDVGYHSPKPIYEGQIAHSDCEWIGGDCYSDGSALRAAEWMDEFAARGTAWLWPALEQEYRERFDEAESD